VAFLAEEEEEEEGTKEEEQKRSWERQTPRILFCPFASVCLSVSRARVLFRGARSVR
jgi:hypothetical protein